MNCADRIINLKLCKQVKSCYCVVDGVFIPSYDTQWVQLAIPAPRPPGLHTSLYIVYNITLFLDNYKMPQDVCILENLWHNRFRNYQNERTVPYLQYQPSNMLYLPCRLSWNNIKYPDQYCNEITALLLRP